MSDDTVQYCPPENRTCLTTDGHHIPLYQNVATKLKVTKGIIASWILWRDQTGMSSGRNEIYSLAQSLNFTRKTVDRGLDWLVNQQYLSLEQTCPPEFAHALLIRKPAQIFWSEGIPCTWCGTKVLRLHKHHYPISKSSGGKETTNICPNCHDEFHFLIAEKSYVPTDQLFRLYKGENNDNIF